MQPIILPLLPCPMLGSPLRFLARTPTESLDATTIMIVYFLITRESTMNEQPYGVPCEHWPPKLTPWWFRLCKWFRDRDLRSQKMTDITLLGCDAIARAVDRNAGILLAPNHSFHWDSYCLLRAAEQLRVPFYFMTAWQVFEVSSRFTRESMQRCGCFSVDREGTDMQALKTAVDILKSRTNPLVVFPEGDIYHTNDRVTPFREGAAAMALMAAKKSDRPVAVIPVAIKRWYLDDPTPSLQQTVSRIERSLHWTEKSAPPPPGTRAPYRRRIAGPQRNRILEYNATRLPSRSYPRPHARSLKRMRDQILDRKKRRPSFGTDQRGTASDHPAARGPTNHRDRTCAVRMGRRHEQNVHGNTALQLPRHLSRRLRFDRTLSRNRRQTRGGCPRLCLSHCARCETSHRAVRHPDLAGQKLEQIKQCIDADSRNAESRSDLARFAQRHAYSLTAPSHRFPRPHRSPHPIYVYIKQRQ